MARIWRDGQHRPVHIYRLVTAGTIEEKIFQRQVTKQGLGGGIVDGGAGESYSNSSSVGGQFHFTREELKDLFSFDASAECDTHDLLNCLCDGDGQGQPAEPAREVRDCQLGGGEEGDEVGRTGIKNLLQWQHLRPEHAQDDLLANALSKEVTFIFRNVIHQTP